MLLRALAASGADNDLLSQLSGTLGTLDSHAQDLLHAAAHRTQIAIARDTHRASALAVALRKLNASYARRTRDLDKARANINALRSEVEEAWKVAEEQAAEVDRLKSQDTSTAAELKDTTDAISSRATEPATDDDNTLEDDTSDSALPDGASIDLTSVVQVVDVTGTAVVTQARLTTMPSPGRSPVPRVGNSSSSTPRILGPPPSAFAVPHEPSSPATPASDAPPSSSASQVSRVSAARRRSTRKSKASLRLPPSIASSNGATARSRSRSVLRGETNLSRKATRSKSRSRKGKERDASSLPWLTTDITGSFLEMEGRPTGEEDADADGEAEIDNNIADGDEGSAPLDPKPQTGACLLGPISVAGGSDRVIFFFFCVLYTAATPVSSPSREAPTLALSPPTQAHTPQPLSDTPSASTLGIAAPLSTSGLQDGTRRSSDSMPSSPALPSVLSTPTIPTFLDLHHRAHSAAALADFIPDPASIFANATTTSLSTTIDTTTNSTATTTSASALDIDRRGHSLDLPSSTANAGKHHRHAAGAKIRRSISELLNFGSGSVRSRRRSLPFTFKGRSSTRAAPVPGSDNGSRSGVGSSSLQHSLNLNDASVEGSEDDGWEDTREDEGAAVTAAAAAVA